MRTRIFQVISFILTVSARDALSLQGYKFLDNKLATRTGPDNGQMIFNPGISVPNQMSFCAWTYAEFVRFGDMIPVLEILTDDLQPIVSVFYQSDQFVVDEIQSVSFPAPLKLTRRWIKCCLSVDFQMNSISGYINGKDMYMMGEHNIFRRLDDTFDPAKNASMVVRAAHNGRMNQPLIGSIAGIKLWNKKLSETELASYSNCSMDTEIDGSIVNSQTPWNITGSLIERTEVKFSEVSCTKENTHHMVNIPALYKNFQHGVTACNKFLPNSIAGEFKSLEDAQYYYNLSKSNPAVLEECWTGGRVLHWMPYMAEELIPKKEDFFHVYSKEKLQVDLWRASQPNNKKNAPFCVKAYLTLDLEGSWYDFPCEDSRWGWASCVACTIPRTLDQYANIRLKGLCSKTAFDTEFEVFNDESGYISYIGQKHTIIKYVPKTEQWLMYSTINPNLTAVSSNNIGSLGFGTHNWTIRNDVSCSVPDETKILTLSTCKDNEFTCKNGLCIDIELRCNSSPDCDDKSDEFGCRKIDPGESYLKFIAPTVNTVNDSKVVVDVSADIIDILEIDEISSILQVQFYLHFTWLDNRLIYYDLRTDEGLNNLSPLEKQLIWYPVLVFENTEFKLSTVVDDDASITIKKMGDFYLSGLEDPTSRQNYPGQDNPITLSRFYNTRFLCEYNMAWYPFDIQKCQLNLAMKGNSGDFVNLETQILTFLGKLEQNEYIVEKYFMSTAEEDGKYVLKINIILGRRLLAIILTTYIPTMLLTIISHATNYFKPFFFEASVTVNLTSLLVLVTLFVNFSNSLPPTSYIKNIDIYLIFCLMIPFLEVLLHTYIDYLRMDSGNDPIGTSSQTQKDSVMYPEDLASLKQRLAKNDDNGGTNLSGLRKVFESSASTREYQPTVEDILGNTKINPNDLISRNEMVEVEARENLYSHSNEDDIHVRIVKHVMQFGIPLGIITFHLTYWIIGILHVTSEMDQLEKIDDVL